MMERLQKVLASAGIASRRTCEKLIAEGHVTVNGRIVSELGTKVTPGVDVLAVDGRVVSASPIVYMMVNKTPGYVSTTRDPQGRPTVLDLLKDKGITSRLFPVGRLDADSEGLLLLTNDGDLAERLTHPRYGIQKEYLAWVDGRPSPASLDRLRAGIPLDGKPAPVDRVDIVNTDTDTKQGTILSIVVHEGRKHEIRRLCEAIGYPVHRLQRVRLGPLHLGDLAPGASRPLTPQEIEALKTIAPGSRSHPPAHVKPGGERTRRQRGAGYSPLPSFGQHAKPTKTRASKRRSHADPGKTTNNHHN